MTTTKRMQVTVVMVLGLLISVGIFLEHADIGSPHPTPKRLHFETAAYLDKHKSEHSKSSTPLSTGESFSAQSLNGKQDQNLTAQPTTFEERLDAIANTKDPQAVFLLRAYLDDPNPNIREEAIESLAAIGDNQSIAGLGYALSDPESSVRNLAIELLAEIGTETAIYTLTLALHDADADNRLLAVEEISSINSAAATSVLQSFLADEDLRVRSTANEAYLGTGDN